MWFDPSARLATHVLTRMPDRFRRMGRSEWADANRAGAPVDCFLEGPCFDAAGRLHVVDIPYGRIFRVDDDWTMVAEYDGWPNGLKVLPDGALLAADYRRGLMRIDPGAGAATPRIADRHERGVQGTERPDPARRRIGPVHRPGSDRATGSHRPRLAIASGWSAGSADRDGTEPERVGVEHRADPSVCRDDAILRGMAVRAAARCSGGQGAVLRPCAAWHVGPDGLAMDAADRLYISNPGHGCIWVVDPHGVPLISARRKPIRGADENDW